MAKYKLNVDLNALLNSGDRVIIELGCGPNKDPRHIGVDILDLPNVDIVANLNDGLPFLPDQSVDQIHAYSVFEHLSNFECLMREIVRVLKPAGIVNCFVPHFSNPYFFSDYTHIRTFGFYTFFYFCDYDDQPARKVPNFYHDIRIKVRSIKLVFNSPFKVRRYLRQLVGRIVNRSMFLQEFYEENLCFLIPCYGVQVIFERKVPG